MAFIWQYLLPFGCFVCSPSDGAYRAPSGERHQPKDPQMTADSFCTQRLSIRVLSLSRSLRLAYSHPIPPIVYETRTIYSSRLCTYQQPGRIAMLQRFTQARYPNYQGILRFLKYGTERKAQPIVHPRESLIANSSVRVKAGGK